MVPLGFMAQHLWEVGASVFAVLLLGRGLFYLIKGSKAPEAEGMNPRTVRVVACLMLLLGVGIGLAAFLVDAEQPGAHNPDQWGGAVGVAFLAIWVALMVAFSILHFKKVNLPKR
jgi:drug/metabolite transporter (DMT)-like permease